MWYGHPALDVNIDTVIKKQQQFLCDFVDLKAEGWRKYSCSFNQLTSAFWAPWMVQADRTVEQLANNMKAVIKFNIL